MPKQAPSEPLRRETDLPGVLRQSQAAAGRNAAVRAARFAVGPAEFHPVLNGGTGLV